MYLHTHVCVCVRRSGCSVRQAECQAERQGGELINGARPVFFHRSAVTLGDIEVTLDGNRKAADGRIPDWTHT